MGRRRTPTQQELAFDEGYREGVIATHSKAIKRAALAVMAFEASQVVASILSKGPELVLEGLRGILGVAVKRRWKEALGGILAPVMEDAAAPQVPILGVGFDLENDFMAEYFEKYTDRIAKEIVDGTREIVRRELQKSIEEGLGVTATASRLRDALGEISPARAEKIARTELRRAANGANYLAAAESGFYVRKTHVHQADSRVRGEHFFVQTVGIRERYRNGELFAGELSVNCRCHDEYELMGSVIGE